MSTSAKRVIIAPMRFRFFPYDVLTIAAIGPPLSDLAMICVVKLIGRPLVRVFPADSLAFLILAGLTAINIGFVYWAVRKLELENAVLSLRNWQRGLIVGIAAGIVLRASVRGELFAFKNVALSALGIQDFISRIFVAPVIESTFWCGAVYTALRQRHSWWLALSVSATGFAVLHDYMWIHQAAPLRWQLGFLWGAFSTSIILGFGFNATYALTGSLIAPIVAHFIYNL